MQPAPSDPRPTAAEIARLRALAVFSTALALGALVIAARPVTERETEASAFVVRSASGAIRARLDTTGLTIHDDADRPRVQLGMLGKTATLSLASPGGSRAQLAIDEAGTQSLFLLDDRVRKRVRMTLHGDGTAGLELFDSNFTWRARMAVTATGEPSVTLYDAKGVVIAHLPTE
jgi:hypothetical protein